jgi:arylsulfatase A-like enzyme
MSVLRRTDYKYVHFSGLPPLLFNLKDDPGETTNLAGLPGYHGIQLECAESLLSWRAEHLDQSLALAALTPEGLITTKRSN